MRILWQADTGLADHVKADLRVWRMDAVVRFRWGGETRIGRIIDAKLYDEYEYLIEGRASVKYKVPGSRIIGYARLTEPPPSAASFKHGPDAQRLLAEERKRWKRKVGLLGEEE